MQLKQADAPDRFFRSDLVGTSLSVMVVLAFIVFSQITFHPLFIYSFKVTSIISLYTQVPDGCWNKRRLDRWH